MITVIENAENPGSICRAGEILKRGGLVAFPTETVYGLGANALDAEAAARIYAAKGRPSDNPLIVHIARMEDLSAVARNISHKAVLLAERFWPGPLTMIFEKTAPCSLRNHRRFGYRGSADAKGQGSPGGD